VSRSRQPPAPVPPPGPPALTKARADVAAQLQARIDHGRELQARSIQSQADIETYKADERKWREYNYELLRQLFTNETIASEYRRAITSSRIVYSDAEAFELTREHVNQYITKLESILERLELYAEPDGSRSAAAVQEASAPDSSRIFIVHGHDGAPKAEVARFIERLGFEAIILHERPNKGRTLITKFREEASDAGFAVVLMTPDDLGKAEMATDLNPRARQNVVFELGFFIGKLGPERVAALVKGDIERPSDFDGVVYISLDRDDWQTALGRELDGAGYRIDWNKVMRR
jgi:predicted nucleotide-binding protein